jgi:hypothetical protein
LVGGAQGLVQRGFLQRRLGGGCGRRQPFARDPQLQPGHRPGAGTHHPSLRPHAAPDAGASHPVRQHAYRDQTGLPNYDAAAKDFNFVSLYADNAFSGVDRVSDAHQITAGFTTRLVDAVSGGEALRLGLVQRYLLRDQRSPRRPMARRVANR